MIKAGGCHCGAVRFEVEVSETPVVTECNCSICSKAGYLHLAVSAEQFRLLAGQDSLTTYTFGTGAAKHHFCRVCGVKSFYVPRSNPTGFSVNFRCLDDAAGLACSTRRFDGQNWEQQIEEFRRLAEQAS